MIFCIFINTSRSIHTGDRQHLSITECANTCRQVAYIAPYSDGTLDMFCQSSALCDQLTCVNSIWQEIIPIREVLPFRSAVYLHILSVCVIWRYCRMYEFLLLTSKAAARADRASQANTSLSVSMGCCCCYVRQNHKDNQTIKRIFKHVANTHVVHTTSSGSKSPKMHLLCCSISTSSSNARREHIVNLAGQCGHHTAKQRQRSARSHVDSQLCACANVGLQQR